MKTDSLFTWPRGLQTLLLLLAFGFVATSQAQVTNAPKTYFEAFDATEDAVLVKGMSLMGTINSQISFPVEIRAEEIRILNSSNVLCAVAVRTTLGPHQTQTDYVDYDELNGLIQAMASIRQADRSVAQLENVDLLFRTRSGFSIGKSSRGNRVTLFLRSGDAAAERNVMEPFVLDSLAMYLSAAKAKLDLLRPIQK